MHEYVYNGYDGRDNDDDDYDDDDGDDYFDDGGVVVNSKSIDLENIGSKNLLFVHLVPK